MEQKLLKVLFVSALSAVTGVSAKAQNFHAGIKAGANIYHNSGNNLSERYSGFALGGGYLGVSGEKMGLMVEGLFTQTRMVAGDNFNQVYDSYIRSGRSQVRNAEFSFSEFSVPVLLGFKVLPATWIEFGPQFTKIVSMTDRDAVLEEIKNVHKDSYVSAVLGLRVKLPFRLHVSGRYVQGLSNRNNTPVSERWTTQHFQLGVGFGL